MCYKYYIIVNPENGLNELSGRHGKKHKSKPKQGNAPSAAIEKVQSSEQVAEAKPEQTLAQAQRQRPERTANMKSIRKPDPFDVALWGLVIAVGVGVIYYFQLLAMRDSITQQVHTIRVDQRAWVGLRTQLTDNPRLDLPPDNQELSIPIQVSNTGKTPAKDVKVIIINTYLRPITERQDFPKGPGYALEIGYGIMMPNSPPQIVQITPTQEGKKVTMSPELRKVILDGTKYFDVYGWLTYEDFFHKRHRTDFCFFFSGDAGRVSKPAEDCVNHNQMDEEEE